MDANYYLCPAPFANQHVKAGDKDSYLGWSKEVIQQGRTYLRLQPAFPFIQEGLDLINGELHKTKVQTLSDAKTDLVVRNIKELVASISNVRIIPSFKAEASEFQTAANLLNKTYIAWQGMTFSDRSIRRGWQHALAGGTGYLGIRWEPNHWYRGKGEIIMDSYGPQDILPIGLPRSHDLQKAYCVAVKVETPWHEVVRRYPQYRDLIRPSRENSKGRAGTVVAQAVKFASAALRKFGPGSAQENEPAPWPMCDVYHLYIDDDSVNNTGQPILMGEPGTSWEYLVPYIGQEIVQARDPMTGKPTRISKALPDDCRLYPTRRKIVCTDDVVLTPDPTRQTNEYWHGQVPVVQLRGDDWPWGFLGFPLTRCGSYLEKANIELLRGMVDMMNNRLSPSRAYDRNTMSQALAQTINTRIPNQVVGLDFTLAGEQMRPLLPPEYLNVPQVIPEVMQQNEQRLTHQMGVVDAQALARARQLPSGDSLEHLMDLMGPLIKDQSRNMEYSVTQFGGMWKYCVFQFYNASRMMEMFGPQGVLEETFEFKPGDLLPGIVPGASVDTPQHERARKHASNFVFSIAPYSLHELNSISRKLFHLQLTRSGFPIDWWTLADVFDLRNFGKPPMIDDPDEPGQKREASTIFEKWLAQQEIMARFQAAQQPPPGAGGGPPGAGAPGPGGGFTAVHKPTGRPPSGQNPPAMEVKSDGRPIIRESKR